jgi:serine/threonine protein kinase
MSEPSDYDRVHAVFVSVCDLAPAERHAALARACDGDDALRGKVEALLAYHDRAEGPLERPVVTADAAADGADGASRTAGTLPPLHEQPGAFIGPYKLLQPIGEGGFGTVFLAEQTDPVQRRVALKIIKLGMDTRQVVARFEAERQALAMMDHPNIARVLDGGATGSGRPYFVMELVRGDPVTDYCDRNSLGTVDRLDIFRQVCHAVQHAHQKGVIHRDLKPGNVLVTVADGRPLPKVIDFGIAKATDRRLTEKTLFTEHRQLIGTPAYMSPEQAEMSGVDIDTRSDIYSLGVLLYELLTGTTPFDAGDLASAAFDDIRRIIREQEPERPSTRLSSMLAGRTPPLNGDDTSGSSIQDIARHRRTEPAALARTVRGDLDWIVMKCLDKDRTRRYETANGLALDIERYLKHEPVSAGPPAATYRLRKFVRRNRGPVAAAAAISALLLGGIAGTSSGMAWALRAEQHARGEATRAKTAEQAESDARIAAEASAQEAQTEAARANAVVELVTEMVRSPDPHEQRGRNFTMRMLLDEFTLELDGTLEDQPQVEATIRHIIGTAYRNLGEYDRAELHFARAMELAELTQEPTLLLEGLRHWAVMQHDRGDYEEAERLTRQALDLCPDDDALSRARLKRNLSDNLRHQARYTEAEVLALEALETTRRALGDDHESTLGAILNWATLLKQQGRSLEAEPHVQKVLRTRRRVLGDDHPHTISALSTLGSLLFDEGHLTQAEPYWVEALERSRRVLGADHPRTLTSSSDLGTLLLELGRLDEAEPHMQHALQGRVRLLGEDHPSTLRTMANLGVLRQRQGRLADAHDLIGQALQTRRRVLGPEHPDTLNSVRDMANFYWDQGLAAEAEPYLREVAEGRRRVLGDDHDSTLIAFGNLGAVLEELGRLDDAEIVQAEVLQRRRRVSGDAHPATLNALHNLGIVKRMQGDLEAADRLLQESLDGRREVLGVEHAHTQLTMGGLGWIKWRLGRYDEAAIIYADLLEVHREQLGDDHPRTLLALSNLAAQYRDQGQLGEAASLYIEWAERFLDRPNAVDDRDAASQLNSVAVYLFWADHIEDAEPLAREALSILEGLDAVSTTLGAHVRGNLAEQLVHMGRLGEAETLAREVRDWFLQDQGASHQWTLDAQRRLGLALVDQDRAAEAEVILRQCVESFLRLEGVDPWRVARAESTLGACLLALGELDEAEPLLLESYETIRAAKGDEFLHTRLARERIASLYEAWERPEDAARFSGAP